MDFTFKTIAEFNDYFKDEKTCYEFLELQRWDGTPVCPHCGSVKKPYNVKARSKVAAIQEIPHYRCAEKECSLPFTVRTGSIFEGSKVELKKWFQAAYEISTRKKGISSLELAERIDVSQKTAWFINHRLRNMLKDTNPELLTGIVEADETYVGGKLKNKHESKKRKEKTKYGRFYNTGDKTTVVGLLQRDGKVVTYVTPNAEAATIAPIMVAHLDKDATLITDDHKSYKEVGKNYKHLMVKTTYGSYVTHGNVHTNTIEGFWSQLKRGIIGTFHVVSPKHLQRYCNEFSYRYNNKGVSNIERFAESIKQCANTRLTYKSLISNEQ
ncbi:MAG: IS1595 family transposase [Bacteroidetes bacterium]|nr:IS1595 family transposase [Bacteroidota bacterium]